jgi:hypothetical protein
MPVNAVRFIRKMRGGAQAHLMEADDGNFYIVKFQNNPQHRRILVNEFLAAGILDYLQITSPASDIVRVSADFLANNPEVYLQTGAKRLAVEPGAHFGSRHPGHPETMAIYDFIPDSLLTQVANAKEFLAILAFDRWVANADGRQTIYFRAQLNDWLAHPGVPPRKLGFVVMMIDHGFAFNGPHWDLPDSAIAGLYPRRIVYRNVRSVGDFEPWIERIRSFPVEVFDRVLRRTPPEWIGEDTTQLEKLLDGLLRRKVRIAELIQDCRTSQGNPFPNWTKD